VSVAEERDPNEIMTMDEYPQASEIVTATDASLASDTTTPDGEALPASETPAPEGITAPEAAPPASAAPTGFRPASPSGWSDPLTGTDGPRLWDRVIASESARVRRYQRPATVALVEIVGMDAFTRVWGTEIAERTFVRIARTLAVEIRSSDHIARVDAMRFAVLLTETDEIAAINFVERARAACERQPGELRIAIGWASPTAATDLVAALTVAEQRLAEELVEPTPTDADPT
jgi:diguanylate cyclase (GGDEF)-like protein